MSDWVKTSGGIVDADRLVSLRVDHLGPPAEEDRHWAVIGTDVNHQSHLLVTDLTSEAAKAWVEAFMHRHDPPPDWGPG